MKHIDLNCDMGESFGRFEVGNDADIFPYITSCNIACGFHGGDPYHIERTIDLALEHQVQIGAHPGFPDLAGFGRRRMDLPASELRAAIKYQVSALMGMVSCRGAKLTYVKPHGALYNTMVDDAEVCGTVIEAIAEFGTDIKVMGLAGSQVQLFCERKQITFVAEAFADRRYEPNGKLRSRALEHSVLTDPKEAADQVVSIVTSHKVVSLNGTKVPLEAESICVHGDNPKAVEILKAIHQAFEKNQIASKSF